MQQERNNTIDAIRLIAAFLVVFLHVMGSEYADTAALKNFEIINFLNALAKLAVPIFFAISGYLIFTDNKKELINRSKRNLEKIGKILLYSSIIYLIFNIISGRHFLPGATEFFKLIFFAQTGFLSGPLWFLGSLIVVNAIFYLVFRFSKREKWLIIISVACFIILIVTQPYAQVLGMPAYNTTTDITRSWVFAIPFFYLGYLVGKFREFVDKLTLKRIIAGLSLSSVLYLYEFIILSGSTGISFGPIGNTISITMPLVTVAILIMALKLNIKDNLLSKMGRLHSLNIYIIHDMIITIVFGIILYHGRLVDKYYEALLLWILIAIAAFVLSWLFENLKKDIFKRALRPSK